MGYGIILGGGGAALNYSWVSTASYASLPSGKPANTFGFITAGAINNDPIFQNGTVSDLAEGDIVIRLGVGATNEINLLPVGKLYVYPTGCYQYQSGVLVPIESYLYNGSTWNRISVILYDTGTIPSYVSGYSKQTISGTTYLTLGASDMTLRVNNGNGYAYGDLTIDTTNLTKLYARIKIIGGTAGYFGVQPNATDVTGRISSGQILNTAYEDRELDITTANGAHRFFLAISSSADRSVVVSKVWAE